MDGWVGGTWRSQGAGGAARGRVTSRPELPSGPGSPCEGRLTVHCPHLAHLPASRAQPPAGSGLPPGGPRGNCRWVSRSPGPGSPGARRGLHLPAAEEVSLCRRGGVLGFRPGPSPLLEPRGLPELPLGPGGHAWHRGVQWVWSLALHLPPTVDTCRQGLTPSVPGGGGSGPEGPPPPGLSPFLGPRSSRSSSWDSQLLVLGAGSGAALWGSPQVRGPPGARSRHGSQMDGHGHEKGLSPPRGDSASTGAGLGPP